MPVVVSKTPVIESVTPDGGEASAVVLEKPVVGTAPPQGPDASWTLVAFFFVIGAGVGGWVLYELLEPTPFQAGAGFSAFAPLYILAQGIERLIEPFSNLLGRTKEDGDKKTKKEAVEERNTSFAELVAAGVSGGLTSAPTASGGAPAASTGGDSGASTPSPADTVAKAQAVLDRIRRNTAVLAWGIASALAMLACGAFGIRLLYAIGFDVPPGWDIALTGLAIGSGTKPLHDLISNVQKSKEAKADTPKTVST
jgi:hypothetical protein